MALAFPYHYIACPCSDTSWRVINNKRVSRTSDEDELDADDAETFDPGSPRSNFSLFPPEHLLYCEECHDIKCPRCVTEEIICTYCPSCLFEVPSSSIKPDYNRCSRNCFNCPVCMSQLITTSIGEKAEGPFILSCNYCLWSSLDVGMQFDKPQSLRQQVDQRANGGRPKPSYREPSSNASGLRNFITRQGDVMVGEPKDSSQVETASDADHSTDPYTRFEALKSFYKDQLANSSSSTVSMSGLDAYSSPSSLSRIMSLYSTGGSSSRKSKQQAEPMREAATLAEGLLACNISDSSTGPPQFSNYIDRPTPQQLLFQHPHPIGNPVAQHVSELRPMPTVLRTKRSTRCSACKHILVKPEFKVTSTRYRIKLVALNYIPFITLRPVPTSGGIQAPGPDGGDIVLDPGKPSQWIMTLRNPLFESLSVSLGTPSRTPGKYGHKVTILCPEFTIGKNGDVWDDALNTDLSQSKPNAGAGEQIAGKIYDRGRNWTSIVIEVVPTHILKEEGEQRIPDEDVIEIPIRVSLQWTVIEDEDEQMKQKSQRSADETHESDDGKRQLAYWMLVGIGRVQH